MKLYQISIYQYDPGCGESFIPVTTCKNPQNVETIKKSLIKKGYPINEILIKEIDTSLLSNTLTRKEMYDILERF